MQARDILLAELANGRLHPKMLEHEDALLETFMRYGRAVRDGAGIQNLRLMAKIIRGTVSCDDDREANRCSYLMDIAAELSIAEMRLLYRLYKVAQEEHEQCPNFVLADEPEVIPALYPTKEHFTTALGRLMRTGLGIHPMHYVYTQRL